MKENIKLSITLQRMVISELKSIEQSNKYMKFDSVKVLTSRIKMMMKKKRKRSCRVTISFEL